MIYYAPILYLYAFWMLFLAFTALYTAWRNLPLAVKVIAAPVVLLGLIVDVVTNYTIASVGFMEFPAEGDYTLTKRLSTYLKNPASWEYSVANVLCTYFLNPFQVNGHCK